MAPRRYFLLRCAEDRVIANAARTNTWPVSLGIVDRINKVFASGDEVTFIFTITMSGHFQGAARMASPASDEGRNLPTCKIEWLYRGDVPYTNAEHLINPLSDPPQPVRAGKDGTEIDPKVAEELLGLLQKAAANPKPAPTAAPAGGNASPHSGQPTLPAAAANAGGMPGMVGASLMGMPDPTFMMGMNPMLAMMNPMMAGMMNPLATAMMMGSMQSMMAVGMRPGGLSSMAGSAAGRAAVAPSDAGAAERGTAGPKADPQPGPPPGFEGGGMQGRRHGTQDEWEEQQQRFDPRFDGPRGVGPPFRHGPPLRDGPPYGFRPPFERGRFHDHGPSGPPGFGLPARQYGRSEREQDDILDMTYEQYHARFWQLKEVQAGRVAGKENAAVAAPAIRASAAGEGTDG